MAHALIIAANGPTVVAIAIVARTPSSRVIIRSSGRPVSNAEVMSSRKDLIFFPGDILSGVLFVPPLRN